MRSKSKSDLKSLMSVSDSIAELNYERYQGYLFASEARRKMKANGDEGDESTRDVFRPAVSDQHPRRCSIPVRVPIGGDEESDQLIRRFPGCIALVHEACRLLPARRHPEHCSKPREETCYGIGPCLVDRGHATLPLHLPRLWRTTDQRTVEWTPRRSPSKTGRTGRTPYGCFPASTEWSGRLT